MNKTAQTHTFKAEVKQLLHLMVHSLYSNREIFLRELISNASDAADKLRFLALENEQLFEGDGDLVVRIAFDEKKRTIAVSDNGIGMTEEEVIANLGTIAKSGTAAFLEKMSGDKRKDSQLIGQFGVGFYSSFMVADKVEVFSRKAGEKAANGVHWIADGEGTYTVEKIQREQRGTEILLHIKKDAKEFTSEHRLKSLVQQFSDHISLPVQMHLETEQEDKKKSRQWQTVNQAKALWTRNKSEIKKEEYKEFYKHIAHDFEDPLTWTHNQVEGKLEYTSLLYIPARAPFDLWNRDFPRGLKLYVQRVFILDQAEQFLPLYLRFVKGIVDSSDLPLNVSREILQKSEQTDSMRSALTKRVLSMLTSMAKKDADTYQKFWDVFGMVLKEGIAEDFNNKDTLLKLMRFSSTAQENSVQSVSLQDYVSRMAEKQKHIYYLVGESWEIIKNSPHLERLRAGNVEVLLLSDRIDEWFMGFVHEYEGKSFKNIAEGGLELDDLDSSSKEEKQKRKKSEKKAEGLIERLKKLTQDSLKDIRVSHHLVDSPVCLVRDHGDMGAQMRKIMASAGQQVPDTKPILEINPQHALIKRLTAEKNDTQFASLANILIDQARLNEGEILKDPSDYVRRVNDMLVGFLRASKKKG